MERFHSRGRQQCLLEQKNVRIAQLHRISLVRQHERRFIVLGHQYGCRDFIVKTLYSGSSLNGHSRKRTARLTVALFETPF